MLGSTGADGQNTSAYRCSWMMCWGLQVQMDRTLWPTGQVDGCAKARDCSCRCAASTCDVLRPMDVFGPTGMMDVLGVKGMMDVVLGPTGMMNDVLGPTAVMNDVGGSQV